MNTKDIRYFIRCYETTSLHQAAKELFITPQGLSKIIKNLEEEFQVTLFERTAKGIFPTEEGRLLYGYARDLVLKLEEIEINMRRLQEKNRNVYVGYSCGVLHVLPLLTLGDGEGEESRRIIWEELPNAEVKEKVLKGEFDIGYVVGGVNSDGIVQEELYQTKIYAIVYEGHPLYDRESITVDELRNEKLITLNEKFECYSMLIGRCIDCGFAPDIVAKTTESQLIYDFTKQRIGIGIDVDIDRLWEMHPNLHRVEITDISPWSINMIYSGDKREELEPIIKKI